MRKLLCAFSFVVVGCLVSCGVPKSEFEELQAENVRLTAELEECKFGAEKIAATVEKAFKERNFKVARQNIALLNNRHPESPRNEEFKGLLQIIQTMEAEKRLEKQAAEEERVRLANLNNTGMWQVGYYVDDFGEPTKDAYIVNREILKGTFNNTATQDSPLHVKFLIDGASEIAVQLFEYGRNNPVKSHGKEYFSFYIQDRDGKRLRTQGNNRSDRIVFMKSESKKIHNMLMKGGEIKFRCYESDTPTTEYEFNIKNADYYDNAYRKLKGS